VLPRITTMPPVMYLQHVMHQLPSTRHGRTLVAEPRKRFTGVGRGQKSAAGGRQYKQVVCEDHLGARD